jgi:hypothetical protein
MPEHTRLGLHPGAIAAVVVTCAATGTGLGLGADALLGWFEATLDGAPGLLRAAAALPDVVTIVALGLAGLTLGIWVVVEWERETLVCEIHPDGVQARLHKHVVWIDRDEIASACLDRDELVLLDAHGRMLVAGKVDGVGPRRVRRALSQAGYPWSDAGHPDEEQFRVFLEGRDDLGEPATTLIKARAAALEGGEKARARALRAQLSDAGVLVRDRRGEQQYARLPAAPGD